MRYYPIFLNLKNRRVVVVGGGAVAERKTASLLKAGAEVTVVSPEMTPRLAAWADKNKIVAVHRPYRRGDLKRAVLAFAATDNPRVNQAVARESIQKKIWVNVADRSAPADFILPALYAKGGLVIAVSTGAQSPALAKAIRDDLKKRFPAGSPSAAKELARLKKALIEKKAPPALRKEILTRLARFDGEGLSRREREKGWGRLLKEVGLKGIDPKALFSFVFGSSG